MNWCTLHNLNKYYTMLRCVACPGSNVSYLRPSLSSLCVCSRTCCCPAGIGSYCGVVQHVCDVCKLIVCTPFSDFVDDSDIGIMRCQCGKQLHCCLFGLLGNLACLLCV